MKARVAGIAGSVLALTVIGGFAAASTFQSAPAAPVRVVQPAVTPITPCNEEDGSGQALPCRWDASVSGNGVGLSFTVRRATDGGTNYIYDNGTVDHAPAS